MNLRFWRWLALSVGAVSFCCLALVGLKIGFAQDESPWLTAEAPTVAKIAELPANVGPQNRNTDCFEETRVPDAATPNQTLCTFNSPMGVLAAEGLLKTGNNTYARLTGQSSGSVFLPTVDSSIAMVSISAPTIGNTVGIYHHITRGSLWHNWGSGATQWFNATTAPDIIIKNPLTGTPLQIAIGTIAFSGNGDWMVADMPQAGLVRVHMTDYSVQLFAGSLEPQWFLGQPQTALAISDDGRYVAADNDTLGGSSLTMYDTSTCTDQLNVAPYDATYCSGKNILSGTTLAGNPFGDGILTKNPGLLRPVDLRFADDQNLTFDAEYDVDGSSFKAASYNASTPDAPQHTLGLLGLGDSYISGQGAFNYINGTDTQNNPCHLSSLSYPYLLGAASFNSYASVACSGAKTIDLTGGDKHYKGQVRDGTTADKRETSPILANYLPGYLYQQEFASAYHPKAMLLSVGGDDVNFADIVKQCVANSGGGTCYDTYEDRLELINSVNAIYPKLVKTYTTLRTQSAGARLYVVGYPQIAKPGGICLPNVHLNKDEVQFSAQLISYLNGVIRAAASTAGVVYVNTESAFNGHRLCEASSRKGQSAMNGFTVGRDAGITIPILNKTVNFIGSESYHPTPLGYQLLANSIAAQTNNLTALMPAPGVYKQPIANSDADILQNIHATGRPTSTVYDVDDMTPDVLTFDDHLDLNVSGAEAALQPDSSASVVLHSQAITLANATVDADGNVQASITIPNNIDPGYHTLHVYGTAMDGSPVDLQKIVYIARSADDFNHGCGILPASGLDADADGIDDACDPEIAAADAVGAPNNEQSMVTASIAATDATNAADQPAAGTSKAQAVAAPTLTSTPQILATATSGTVTATGSQNASELAQAGAQIKQPKLYRLNWAYVASGGLVLSLAATVYYYIWRKM